MVSRGKYRRKTCHVCGSDIQENEENPIKAGEGFLPIGSREMGWIEWSKSPAATQRRR